MTSTRLFIFLAALTLAVSPKVIALEQLHCIHSVQQAPVDAPKKRHYAPDREADTLHVALDITPDFQKRTIAGKATIRFKPLAKPLRQLRLDAVDLAVSKVESAEAIENWNLTDEQLVVTFSSGIPVDKEASVTVHYAAEPQQGLYFRTPEMGYLRGETHLWTQGQPEDHRHWYPAHDFPNEKFSSEIICRVPEGMTVLSNGKLISRQADPATGLVSVHWKQDQPHVNYLISLVAGYFEKMEDRYRDIPLAFFVPPSDLAEATNTFGPTKEMFSFFEKEIGVPYPWEKYYQVVVRDFIAGGMENTSLTILTDRTLFTSASENIRSSENLVAHELAHQWFGDLVTCKDWSHLWLNEGFATYYALLWEEHKHGQDSMLYSLWQTAGMITSVTNAPRPMVWRQFEKPWDQFGYLAYQKGAWLLHMLRSQLGENTYQEAIRRWIQRHQFDTVVTENLNAAIEEVSGRSHDRFFDQWAYHAHHPELEFSYSWDQPTRTARVSVKQTQKLSADVLLFHFPLRIRFEGKASKTGAFKTEQVVQVKEKEEDFYFSLSDAPELVLIDPELELLARIDFKPSTPLLHAQLVRGTVPARLRAVEQLGDKKDKESVAQLKKALNSDPFFGVRIEAAKALQKIHSTEALDALLASQKQPDARVRRQVTASIGGFFREPALDALLAVAQTEKNPDIVAQALRSLGPFANESTRDTLLRQLQSESYRNTLADAAIAAMRAQGLPEYISPLKRALSEREDAFSTRGFAAGLDSLAFLARHEENKAPVRKFLLARLNHPKRGVRVGAIGALGTLEDPLAIAALETFASAGKQTPEREAAEKALAVIRAAQRQPDNLNDLRQELVELQKQSRETQKELDALKKKIDIKDTKPSKASKK